MHRYDWAVALFPPIMMLGLWAGLSACGLFGDGEAPTLPDLAPIRDDQFCEQGIGRAREAYAKVRGLIELACIEGSAVPAVRDNCEAARDASKVAAAALNRNDCPLVRDAVDAVDLSLRAAAAARRLSEHIAEAIRAERVAAEGGAE